MTLENRMKISVFNLRNISILFILISILSACGWFKSDKTIPSVPSGTIVRINHFQSDYRATRPIDIWLPEGYSSDKQYPVLYMHDGQMLFDSAITYNQQEWEVDETISKLSNEGIIDACIVVGIWNSNLNRHSDYFPKKPFDMLPEHFRDSLLNEAKRYGENPLYPIGIQSDNYLKFLVEELKPYIDQHYSTKPEMKNTFVAGSSMGGLISMYAICEYPETFGGAACMSTHWTGTFTNINNPIPAIFIKYLDENLPDPLTHKIYFDLGTTTLDSLYSEYQNKVDSVMMKHAYSQENWQTVTFPGDDHTEKSWRNRFHIPLRFLMGKD
jgi:predicted alpha/beta superfamily hydrolase